MVGGRRGVFNLQSDYSTPSYKVESLVTTKAVPVGGTTLINPRKELNGLMLFEFTPESPGVTYYFYEDSKSFEVPKFSIEGP